MKQHEQRRRGEGDSECRAAGAGPRKVPSRAAGASSWRPGTRRSRGSPSTPRCCSTVSRWVTTGRTAYERNKGKKAKVLGMEFGEAILWKRRPVGGALGKLSCLWEDGLYVGIRGQSGELIVSDREGVWRTRTVQRKPIEDRWPEGAYEMIQTTPWTDAEEDEMQAETEKFVTEMTEAEKEAEKQVELEDKIPARFYIRKVDLEKNGYTANCPECRAALRGTTKQNAHGDVQSSPFRGQWRTMIGSRGARRGSRSTWQGRRRSRTSRSGGLTSRTRRGSSKSPPGTNAMTRKKVGMDLDGERERELEGPSRPLEGGDEQGTFEETATAH